MAAWLSQYIFIGSVILKFISCKRDFTHTTGPSCTCTSVYKDPLYKDLYPYLIERDPDQAPSDPDLYPGIQIQLSILTKSK